MRDAVVLVASTGRTRAPVEEATPVEQLVAGHHPVRDLVLLGAFVAGRLVDRAGPTCRDTPLQLRMSQCGEPTRQETVQDGVTPPGMNWRSGRSIGPELTAVVRRTGRGGVDSVGSEVFGAGLVAQVGPPGG